MTPLQKAQARLGARKRSILQKDRRIRRVKAANLKVEQAQAGREFIAAFFPWWHQQLVGYHTQMRRVRRQYYGQPEE